MDNGNRSAGIDRFSQEVLKVSNFIMTMTRLFLLIIERTDFCSSLDFNMKYRLSSRVIFHARFLSFLYKKPL